MLTVIGDTRADSSKYYANINLRLSPSDVERSGIYDGCEIQERDTLLYIQVTKVREGLWNFSVIGVDSSEKTALHALLNVVKYFYPSEENWTKKFRVKSEICDETYEVTEYVGGFWTCTCRGFQYRHECKHIKDSREQPRRS